MTRVASRSRAITFVPAAPAFLVAREKITSGIRLQGGRSRRRRSFRPDVGRLDHRPPLVDVGLLARGERLRRLLLARIDLLAEFAEARSHAGIGERVAD